MQVRERHERRLAILEAMEVSEEDRKAHVEEIERLRAVIETLGLERTIKRVTELESKYMTAIGKLEQLDQTIIIDAYINGKPYWKIGRDVGYSEVGIQKRVNKIIEILAKYL
jgi:DNA-directed RNA polymerase specialized sigma subunit